MSDGTTTWGDVLTKYGNGPIITYDGVGNPLNDGTRAYTWEHGRQLASLTMGGVTWNYTYNADGMRTQRTNGQTTYTYTYNGDKLTYMTVDGYLHLYFAYDASGVPMSVTYNGVTYYYVTNVQGDVIGILDSAGTQVATYAYDAWGNPLAGTDSQTSEIGTLNPLRYRSYIWDSETKLYYLQSRYYNPELGRFINADDLEYLGADGSLTGYNLFAYCGNKPIIGSDPTGHFISIIIACISDYYHLHRKVQKDCERQKGWVTEVSVRTGEKRGRLDLYDETTNEYYEVKSRGAAFTLKGDIRESTSNQMIRYDNSTIVGRKCPEANGLKPVRGNQFVSGKVSHGVWDAEYHLERSGLIVYDISLNSERASAVAIVAGVAILALSTGGVSLPYTAPAFGFLGG